MATKLKNMHLTSVDLVRAGANQEADICLFKSAEPPEATESPTEHEKGIFKRFIDWLHKNAPGDENEPQKHIEKAVEQPDLEFIYKTALAESLQSIMADETLTEVEKKRMTEESLRQYNDKIDELERDEEDYDGGDDIDEKAIEEVDDFDKDVRDDIREEEDRIDEIEDEIEDRAEDKIEEKIIRRVLVEEPERYDEIEEIDVHKYNHNHGADGKFSSNPGASGGSTTSRAGGTTKSAVQNAIKGAKSPKKVKQALDKAGIEYEDHSEEFGYMNLRCPRNDGGYVRVYKPRHKNQDVIVRDYNPVDLTPSGVPTFDPSWQQAVGLWDGKTKKSAAYDHIEEVEKYNHNHDAAGKFSSSPGTGGGGSSSGSSRGSADNFGLRTSSPAGWGGGWAKGTADGYSYDAKVYDEGSQYGISGGSVSKLTLKDSNGKWVLDYDRGEWSKKPNKKERAAIDKITNHYDKGKERDPAEDSWDTSYNPNSRLNKSANTDEIDEVEKFNPYHGADGRFSSANGATSMTVRTKSPAGQKAIANIKAKQKAGGGSGSSGSKSSGGAAEQVKALNNLPKKRGVSKVKYEDIKEYEKVLDKMPIGTKLRHKIDAGTETYEKTEQREFGGSQWKKTRAPWNDTINESGFDVAQFMAGSGVISRGDYELVDEAN